MITQNFIQSFFWSTNNYSLYSTFKCLDVNGDTFSYRTSKLDTIFNITANKTYYDLISDSSVAGNVLCFGTGVAEAKVSDYKLESLIEDNVFTPSTASTISSNNYPGNITITQSFVYTGSSDITITEVGLINSVNKSSSTSDGYQRLLLVREILQNPITVSKGQQFTITMTIS